MKTIYSLVAAAVSFGLASTANAAEFTYEGITFNPYARVVGGISYANHGYKAGETGSIFEVASNQWGTSYIGLGVAMPLAEGFSGIANLESGFGTINGETNVDNVFFNRQANVGVNHTKFGQITFGTHLALSQDIVDMDPMAFQSMGINTLVNGTNDTFAENSVIYRSAQFYGFELALMKRFGGEVSDSKRSSGTGVSLHYQYQNLAVRAIYQEQADEFGRHTGGEFYGLGTQGHWHYVKTKVVAASYQLNDAKLFAGYQHVEAPDAGHLLSYTFDDEAKMLWTGLNYAINSKLTANAAFYRVTQAYSDKTSNLYTLGLNYAFNDKFTFYTTVGHIGNNKVDAALSNNVGVNNHALSYDEVACSNTADCNGANQTGIYAGVVLKL